MKIIWTNRYSDTDEFDKAGRWARVGMIEHSSKDVFKTKEIAWIHKHIIDSKDVFTSTVHIFISGVKQHDTLEEAKASVIEVINDFKINYLENN